MSSQQIVIEVSGGVICAVYTDIQNADISLIDWDNHDEDTSVSDCVGRLSSNRLELMESELREAIQSKM